MPTHVEGRNDTQQESQLPPTPLPLRFSDWSSLESPCTRTIPHSAPDRGEQNVNIPNQLNVQSGTVPRHETIRTNSPEEVIISLPRNQQVEEQNVHVIEMEPNPLSIEVRMQRDDMRTDGENNIPINQASGNVMPSLSVGDLTPSPNVNTEAENNSDTSRGSHVRNQEIGLREVLVIPPGERATSNRNRRMISENIGIGQNYPHEQIYPKECLHLTEEIIWMIVVMIIGCIEVKETPMKEEGHQMKEGIPTETEDLQEEEDHKMMGDPQIDMEDTLVEEDHLMEEDPLMMEGHLIETEDHQDALIEEDPQDLEDLLDQ